MRVSVACSAAGSAAGSMRVKLVPSPAPALDVEAAAHGARSARAPRTRRCRSRRPWSRRRAGTAGRGRSRRTCRGRDRRSRSTPIAPPPRRCGRSPAVRGAGFDRVLDEMAERLLERGRIDRGPQARRRRAAGPHGRARLAAIAAVEDRRGAAAARRAGPAPRWARAGRADRSSCRPKLAASRSCRSRNSGLSAWRSALRASSVSWLTRFLMSCMMKAKRRLNSSKRCASASACWLRASAS